MALGLRMVNQFVMCCTFISFQQLVFRSQDATKQKVTSVASTISRSDSDIPGKVEGRGRVSGKWCGALFTLRGALSEFCQVQRPDTQKGGGDSEKVEV